MQFGIRGSGDKKNIIKLDLPKDFMINEEANNGNQRI